MAGKNKKEEIKQVNFALGKENYYLLIIGFVIIIIGYLLMIGGKSPNPDVFKKDELFSFRRVTLAPITVLFGFVFEIYAIMKKPKEANKF
jgi:membrane-bound ClpP family serine protease